MSGHTCINTCTTIDGNGPPPCVACQQAPTIEARTPLEEIVSALRADLDCATRFRIGDLSVLRYADGWQIRRGWEQWGPFPDQAVAIAEARRMGAEEKEKRDVHL